MRALCFIVLACCGYSLAQAERTPRGFKRFYVNQAMDASTDVGGAATVTRVLRTRVNASSAATLVALNEAEGVLEARIEAISDAAGVQAVASATQQVQVSSYALGMTGTLRLVDAAGATVWASGPVFISESYLAGSNSGRQAVVESAVAITESNRRRALERAAERLGDELYTRLMEGF